MQGSKVDIGHIPVFYGAILVPKLEYIRICI